MHDDCAGTPTKSNASGGSGYRDGIDGAGSHGTASPKSSSDIHSLPPGSSINTPLRAKLSREEPEARNRHIRFCEGWGWQHPHLLGAPLAKFATHTVAGGPAFESRHTRAHLATTLST